jgi:DNA-binding transcriptional ArsR family regulator
MSRRDGGANARSDLGRAARIFSALGDETRLAIVARLCEGGPQSITELTASAPVTRQAVTKHLHVLDDAGLVHDSRRGRERIWDLETGRLAEAGRFLEGISKKWDEALGRSKTFVEHRG